MVGRELPNLRPNGEDHRGAGGGDKTGTLRRTGAERETLVWRSWVQMRIMKRIHKALGFLRGLRLVLPATLFDSRV